VSEGVKTRSLSCRAGRLARGRRWPDADTLRSWAAYPQFLSLGREGGSLLEHRCGRLVPVFGQGGGDGGVRQPDRRLARTSL